MTSHRTSPLLLALAVAAGGALSLSLAGCTGIQEALSQEVTAEYTDTADVTARADTPVPWLPADATAIVLKTKRDGEVATAMTRSGSALDPKTCVEVERQSAPTVHLDDAPDVYAKGHVFACGAWSVIATDTGWYGWTPNSPGEKEQSPTGS
jgi:hypothetical protein